VIWLKSMERLGAEPGLEPPEPGFVAKSWLSCAPTSVSEPWDGSEGAGAGHPVPSIPPYPLFVERIT
jgi:hypothetical protein